MDYITKIKEFISDRMDETMDENGNFDCAAKEAVYLTLCNLDSFIDSLSKVTVSKSSDESDIYNELAKFVGPFSKRDFDIAKHFYELRHKEGPVSDDLNKATKEYSFNIESELFHTLDRYQQELWREEIESAFKAGDKRQKQILEKNRLAACDRATKEEIEREQDFVDKVLVGEHRQPTFSDAIEYGIKWQKNHVWHDAKKEKPGRMEQLLIDDGVQILLGDATCLEETDKWCYITDVLPIAED